MGEPQPELRWAPLPPKPKNTGRIWLIIGLSVLALAIAAIVLFAVLSQAAPTTPGASPSPQPSNSATSSPSPTASVTPTETPTPTPTATTAPTQAPEPPKPVDPDVAAFADQVSPYLSDAVTGLGYIADSSGEAALSDIGLLEQDAQRLSDAAAPSSISAKWRDGVAAYASRLGALREAAQSGSSIASPVDDARAAVRALQDLVS